jgi:hypothetical protein
MTDGNAAPTVRDRLINRRTLIQAGGGTALAAVALGDRFFARPHFTTAESISTIAADIKQSGVDFSKGDMPAGGGFSSASAEHGLTVQAGLRGAQYVSPVIKTDFAMTHVGPNWSASYDGGWFDLEVRLSQDGRRWTEWTPVSIESFEGDSTRPGKPGIYGSLLNGYGATRVQYRARFDTRGGPVSIRNMTMTCLNVNDGPRAKVLVPGDGQQVQASPYIAKPRPVSRAGWGCDESLRFSGGEEIWGKEFARWRAIVPHHTATTNNYYSAAAEVRAIYYYHAVTHGWGDIGYHALVGNNKATYEGRKSPDGQILAHDLMAGHVLQCNAGSFGFAFIGDFSYVYIPSGMLRAGQKLAAWVCAERDIDPLGNISFQRSDRSYYRGPAIAAHRLMQRPDLYPTACPGDVGYSQFPWFRRYVQQKLDAAPEKTPVPGDPTPTPSPKRYIFVGSGRSANSTASTLAWDNNSYTFWETTSDSPPKSARIYFDLGEQKYVSRVTWFFRRSGWADWCTIEWSNDRVNWTFLADASNPASGIWYERLAQRKLRYVRFVFQNPNKDAKLGGLAEVRCFP